MSIDTNLAGRLRNTSLPYSHGLLPLFEAVANSIHAIEDAPIPLQQGRISVEIVRDAQRELALDDGSAMVDNPTGNDITGFVISDNGIGFDDDNMRSFLTLDSDHKSNRGGRGVGRLLWLKAFRSASVESVYQAADGTKMRRNFAFDSQRGVSDEKLIEAQSADCGARVSLTGFAAKYRAACRKTAPTIAVQLLEHCLWYFVREGGAPKVHIIDGDEQLDLDVVYHEQMIATSAAETITLKGFDFELVHVQLTATSSRSHSLAFCAASRLVKEESLKGKIPGLFGTLRSGESSFIYECYVSSPLLDERVRSERTSFDIEEEPLELLTRTELSQAEITQAVTDRAAEYLSEYLAENRRKGRIRVEEYVSHKAPKYRPILSRVPDEQLGVDPEISDKDLDLLLHKHVAQAESELLSQGHEHMQPQDDESVVDYRNRLSEYLKTAEDLKKSDLAAYVSHRRVVVDLLEAAIRQRNDGTYAREDLIHTLIMPMRADSNEVDPDSCNLWLIDEGLAFHNYLASDKPIRSMPITDCNDTKEPDLLALNVYDNPVLVSEDTSLPLASIVVVELKRPMRNNAAQGEDKDPIEQALGYLQRVRKGDVKTASGRPIPQSKQIPGYCYVVCDITPSVEERCRMKDAIRTSDHLGYFFYHKTFGAYVEVISFDQLVNSAKKRNRAFFDQLGLPTR
ncbi:ATP-binding protein [Botrimarina sp.]|uniref:ATP-binding protein n=1 Tax=Botrimarina sp. TaxID=2795802 RepID=UPI0032EBF5FD